MPLKNDVSHGVRRCYVDLKLERRNKYMYTFAKQSNFCWDFCSAMAESWKKLNTSNVFLSFIDCSNRNRSVLVCDFFSYNPLFVIHFCQSVHMND